MTDNYLPQKLKRMQPYEPNEILCKVKLDANESGISLPDDIRSKLAEIALSFEYNRYPDPAATSVCKAFADFWGIDPDLVVAGNGSDELISVIVNSFLERGDKAMVLLPDFSMYAFYCGLSENPCVSLQKDANDQIDTDEVLSRAKRERAKLLMFSNPCNPTGNGISAGEVKKLVKGFDGIVLLDEAYMDFWDQSLLPEVEKYDNLIILRTCSKAVGLAALRLGFAVSNPALAANLRMAKSPYNVNGLTQAMGTEVLKASAFLKESAQSMIVGRKQLFDDLTALSEKYPGCFSVRQSVTNFILVDMKNAALVFQKLLQKSVSVRCLSDSRLRITAGIPEENLAFLKAFEEILSDLK